MTFSRIKTILIKTKTEYSYRRTRHCRTGGIVGRHAATTSFTQRRAFRQQKTLYV